MRKGNNDNRTTKTTDRTTRKRGPIRDVNRKAPQSQLGEETESPSLLCANMFSGGIDFAKKQRKDDFKKKDLNLESIDWISWMFKGREKVVQKMAFILPRESSFFVLFFPISLNMRDASKKPFATAFKLVLDQIRFPAHSPGSRCVP